MSDLINLLVLGALTIGPLSQKNDTSGAGYYILPAGLIVALITGVDMFTTYILFILCRPIIYVAQCFLFPLDSLDCA